VRHQIDERHVFQQKIIPLVGDILAHVFLLGFLSLRKNTHKRRENQGHEIIFMRILQNVHIGKQGHGDTDYHRHNRYISRILRVPVFLFSFQTGLYRPPGIQNRHTRGGITPL